MGLLRCSFRCWFLCSFSVRPGAAGENILNISWVGVMVGGGGVLMGSCVVNWIVVGGRWWVVVVGCGGVVRLGCDVCGGWSGIGTDSTLESLLLGCNDVGLV